MRAVHSVKGLLLFRTTETVREEVQKVQTKQMKIYLSGANLFRYFLYKKFSKVL